MLQKFRKVRDHCAGRYNPNQRWIKQSGRTRLGKEKILNKDTKAIFTVNDQIGLSEAENIGGKTNAKSSKYYV